MRDIKFRGKNKEGKWIYGTGVVKVIVNCKETNALEIIQSVDYDELDYYVPNYDSEEIRPDTIGQYTGLKAKNGIEIYEGDILLSPEWFGTLKCVCIYQQENTVNPIQGFGLYSYDSYFKKYNTLVESDEWDEFEVIGNIYDNPELLEEGE